MTKWLFTLCLQFCMTIDLNRAPHTRCMYQVEYGRWIKMSFNDNHMLNEAMYVQTKKKFKTKKTEIMQLKFLPF